MESHQKILVCVTQQKTCERLIRKAVDMKKSENDQLYVIHVSKNNWSFLDNIREGEALEYLFGISKSVGANLTVLRSDEIVKTIADFAREYRINCIIMGQAQNDHSENNFYNELKALLTNMEIHVLPSVEI